MAKMVKIVSLSGVAATYLEGGKEVIFENGEAEVTEEEAQTLIDRSERMYARADKVKQIGFDSKSPSPERLEHEFGLLYKARQLPFLKNWLVGKMRDLEPALLSMQQAGVAPGDLSSMAAADRSQAKEMGEEVSDARQTELAQASLPKGMTITSPDGSAMEVVPGEEMAKIEDAGVDGNDGEDRVAKARRVLDKGKKKKKKKKTAIKEDIS